MAIQIADKFDVLTSSPIDSRMVVQSYIDMLSIDNAVRYTGMIVYVIDEDSRYKLDWNNTFVKMFEIMYDDNPNGLFVTYDFKNAVNNSMTTDNLPEGTTNLYFKESSLANAFVRQQHIIYNINVDPSHNNIENSFITTNFQLMQIETTAPCRVRIYATEIGRANDINRAYGVAPNPDDGLFVDVEINTINTPYNITPSIMIYAPDDSSSSQIYSTVTNIGGATTNINVTLTYVNFGTYQIQL